MSDKQSKNSEIMSPEAALERRVDEMLDTELPIPTITTSPAAPTAPLMCDQAQDASEQMDASFQPIVPEMVPVESTESSEPQDAVEAEDAEMDSLVDDIVVREGDELLAARDAKLQRALQRTIPKPSFTQRLAGFFAVWWHNKYARYGTLLVISAGLTALAAMPTSRYYTLNAVGVRGAASLTILDNTTQQPLKNVAVQLGDRKSKTNQDGLVKLSGLPLGTQSLAVSQAGFSTINKTITLGWGSNPLGEFTMDAVGTQFRFKLTDYLSGKPVKSAEISRGDANAQANDKGELVLTTDQKQPSNQMAIISAEGYRSEKVSLEIGQKQSRVIAMVPSQKEVFVSKQSGKFDLYKMDIDGKNKQLLLAASGHEDGDISVVQNSSGSQVALVSKRDATKNQDGYPLQSLTLIETASGRVLKLDHSERIQIVDWIHDKLIYVKIKAGTSAGNAERYQLMSYDYNATARIQLASANYFNDVVSVQGNLYFTASNNYQGGSSQFVRIGADNTGKQVLLDKTDVWNIIRTSYDSLSLSALSGGYIYKIGDPGAKKVSDTAPNTSETRFYLDASDGKHSLWTDTRDGKGVLLVYDGVTGKDKVLTTSAGLSYPVRWLNARTIVYRVSTPSETADYAVSLDGGAPKKIVDLTSTAGFGKWNYR